MRIKGGMLVAIEGIDGCGKSTTMSRLMKRVCQHHIAVAYAKETTKTRIGKQVRAKVLNSSLSLTKKEQTKLFAKARKACLKQIIIPALEQNELVLCDRYILSNLAYQANLSVAKTGEIYDKTQVMKINQKILGSLYIPADLYIYVSMPAQANIARLSKRTRKQDYIDKKLCNYNTMVSLKNRFKFAMNETKSPVLQVSGMKTSEQRGEKAFKTIWNYIQKHHLQTFSKQNKRLTKHFKDYQKESGNK